MKKLNNLKWFSLGVFACLIVSIASTPAFASSLKKSAQLVYNNIKISLNGTTITPTDASGNVVEPFTINGTTYLPVRAISNALGLNVNWNSSTNTVEITNTKPSNSQSNSSSSGNVIYDSNGIKITYLGIGTTTSDQPEIKLYIQNSTNDNYIIQSKNTSVNGVMAYPTFSCHVASGKSAYDGLIFEKYMPQNSQITTINSAEFTFRFFKADDWNNKFDSGVITINN